MKNILISLALLLSMSTIHAQYSSKRIPQLENTQVKVWKTIVYPNSNHALPMHRHEYNRVLVALTDGQFKITNDKGRVHYFSIKKDHAYFLTKDKPNELHNDENISQHPIEVMVVELKP